MRTVALLLVLAAAPGAHAKGKGGPSAPEWLTEEMPLPLAVRTADDLKLKAAAERQYLLFNLVGRGKLAWDKGDFAEAARRWEELLKTPGIDAQLASTIKPFAIEARKRAGGAAPAEEEKPPAEEEKPPEEIKPKKPATVTVTGVVTGGDGGPGGAVVSLRRADGSTPRPRAGRPRAMLQKDKAFAPHVLAVPVGATVNFRNEDPLFHNVFSLSPARKFDSGFKNAGQQETVKFTSPGVVEVLCNIHATMQAFVVVVDTPYFATAGASGAFTIKGVPPGEYEATVWHESASAESKSKVTVGEDGGKLALTVGADKRKNPFPPDKYGKPRQQQLGY